MLAAVVCGLSVATAEPGLVPLLRRIAIDMPTTRSPGSYCTIQAARQVICG